VGYGFVVPMTLDLAAHWNGAYAAGDTARSWYQPAARTSLDLITGALGRAPTSVVDVGGGASTLVDGLLELGVPAVTVLDVSRAAMALAAQRLGARADAVTWLATDLLAWRPARRYDAWHDRAVLHFLTDDEDRRRYGELMATATVPGAVAVIGGFSPEGPEQCSGLPVRRAAPSDLVALAGPRWSLVEQRVERHRTPSGDEQAFAWVALRRLG
jgi:hypothetical protein